MGFLRSKMKFFTILLIITIGLLGACMHEPIGQVVDTKPDVIEIEFWYGLSGNLESLMKEFIDEYDQQQSKVRVVGVAQGNYEKTAQALRAAIVRRKPPAVVLLEDQRMQFFANVGALSPLDSLINLDPDFNYRVYFSLLAAFFILVRKYKLTFIYFLEA